MKKSILFLFTAIVALTFFSQGFISSDKYKIVEANEYVGKGCLYNSVVYVSFAQSDEEGNVTASDGNKFYEFDDDFFGKMDKMYNSSTLSVKNYFIKQSKGSFSVETTFFGEKESIKLEHDVEYYKPKYRWENNEYVLTGNERGYDNRFYDSDGNCVDPASKDAKESIDGYYREQALIREILGKCVVSGYNGDYNGDGIMDSVVFITDSGKNDVNADGWGDVLWSHMGVAHTFPQNLLKNYYYTPEQETSVNELGEAKFGNFLVSKYNFMSAGEICKRRAGDYSTALSETDRDLYDVGLLCHEMAHNLGLYDYYSYEDLSYESVGEFDVLANYTPVPQNMLAYLRLKMGWLTFDDVLYLNSSGTYSLSFSNSNKGYACAKIVLSDYLTTGEYFILEARSKDYATYDDPFDGALSGSGLIIYRVSEKNAYINSKGTIGNNDYGNMFGADEVYVYRKNAGDGTNNKLTEKKILGVEFSTALLGDSLSSCGLTAFGSKEFAGENPIIYSDGITNSQIEIKQVTEIADKSANMGMTFSLNLPDDPKSTIITLDMSQCVIKNYYDGHKRLFWSSNVKDGKAYVIALRATDRLKNVAESNRANITIEDIKNGRFSYYKTLYSGSVPLAEKNIKLPEFKDGAVVFLAIETSDGLRSIRYVGEIPVAEEDFSQYLLRVFDPIYLFAIFAVVLLVLLAAVLLFTGKRTLKSNVRRR